jgi:hypothetical protein
LKYKHKPEASLAVPPVTGANAVTSSGFHSHLPSTWPPVLTKWDDSLVGTLRHIFHESILDEIANVMGDIKKSNPDLQKRGHVIAIVLMVAVDAISGYAYRGKSGIRIETFIKNHCPNDYHAHASDIGELYRNCLIHNWNLFEVSIGPGEERIEKVGGSLCFGLLNFFEALQQGVEDFLVKLQTDAALQRNALKCYNRLRKKARP